MAGRVLAPLSRIAETTARISESTLHERLALTGPRDELRLRADTIDRLLERLEAAFGAQRRFVTNASHELRTPLAMMRTFLDVAIAKPQGVPPQLRALDANLRGALDQTDRLLESFLMLARAQNGLVGEQSSVQLEPIITTALTARAAAIAQQQIEVRTTLATIRVVGAETLLSRVVENVIENAVRHNQRGGEITVEMDAHHDRAQLAVESSGPVLDPEAVGQLAQRSPASARSGPAPNGHGLGLSRILVVEDVPVFANAIAEGLRDQGMAVDVAYDGHAGPSSSTSTRMTSSCSTATSPESTATSSAGSSPAQRTRR